MVPRGHCARVGARSYKQAEMTLARFRHVGDVDQAAHIAGPRLLGERLHADELPELPLGHDDLGYAVAQNPVLKGGQTGLLAIGEHGVRNGFPHETRFLDLRLRSARLRTGGRRGCAENRAAWRVVCKPYRSPLNDPVRSTAKSCPRAGWMPSECFP